MFPGEQSERGNIKEAGKQEIPTPACCCIGFPKIHSNGWDIHHKNIGQA